MKEEALRLFVAASVSAEVMEFLKAEMPHFQDSDWRLVPEQNLHLTLFFIGNSPAAQFPEIREKVQEIGSRHSGFRLTFEQIEAGPNRKSPRLIWARFRANKAFEELARDLQITLAPEVPLPKNQVPHITLARKRK